MSKYIISCDPANLDLDSSYVFVYDWIQVDIKDKSEVRKEKIKKILKDYSSE